MEACAGEIYAEVNAKHLGTVVPFLGYGNVTGGLGHGPVAGDTWES